MGEIKAGVTLMQDFCRPGNVAYQGYIDYIGRSEAQRNAAYENYSLFSGYNDYMGNPVKTTGLFTREKDELTVSEKKELKALFDKAQKNGSIMWQTVISFDNRWLEEQGVMNQADRILDERKIKEVCRLGVERMLGKEDLEHALWSASIHYNTDNIHVHVATVEPTPMRREKLYVQYHERKIGGKVSKEPLRHADGSPVMAKEYVGRFRQSSMEAGKSVVVNELLHTRELNQKINFVIRDQIVKGKKERRILQDPIMKQSFLELDKVIPREIPANLCKYNAAAMAAYRPVLDEISRHYIQAYHGQEYEELKQMLYKQGDAYRTAYGNTDRNYEKGKLDDLYARLGNAVLTELKEYRKEKSREEALQIAPGEGVKAEGKRETAISRGEPGGAVKGNLSETWGEIGDEIGDDLIMDDDVYVPGEESLFIQKQYQRWFREKKKALQLIKDGKRAPEKIKEGLDILEVSRKSGSPIASYALGELYAYGRGTEINLEKSETYFKEAFEKFRADALQEKSIGEELEDESVFDLHGYLCYRIGKQYDRGLGTERDTESAREWYLKSGSAFAWAALGDQYYYGNDTTEQDYGRAFGYYQWATEGKEIPFALLKLAIMYENGQGVERDEKEAEEYYKKALLRFFGLEMKEPDRVYEYQIGRLLYEGKGTSQDKMAGEKFLLEAARDRSVDAQYYLTKIYINEKRYDRLPEAVEWMAELAEKGKQDKASYALGEIYLNPESGKGLYDPEKGIACMEELCGKNNMHAQVVMGMEYLKGVNVGRNRTIAKIYFSKAAGNGNEFAGRMLARMTVEEMPVRSCHGYHGIDRALLSLQRSMQLEYEQAMKNIREYDMQMSRELQLEM